MGLDLNGVGGFLYVKGLVVVVVVRWNGRRRGMAFVHPSFTNAFSRPVVGNILSIPIYDSFKTVSVGSIDLCSAKVARARDHDHDLDRSLSATATSVRSRHAGTTSLLIAKV